MVEVVTSRHEVAVVDTFDEGLNLSTTSNLLLGMGTSHSSGSSLNTDDKGVTEGVRLSTLVESLDNNDFLTGLSTASNDSYLIGFQEFGHYYYYSTTNFGNEKWFLDGK